mmetsp:Transcript_27614/g.62586  ORF Transcript_27614/g.62586 Transcript_27614/m.62586 type:complete len:215 (-) Transcript_27614:246-890(-)
MRYSCGSLCTNGLRLPPRSRASGCHPREHRHSRPGHHSRHARHARHPHHRRPGHPLAHHHAGHHSRNIRRPHHASHHLRHHHHRHSRHHPHGALRAGEHPAHPLAITLAALASLASLASLLILLHYNVAAIHQALVQVLDGSARFLEVSVGAEPVANRCPIRLPKQLEIGDSAIALKLLSQIPFSGLPGSIGKKHCLGGHLAIGGASTFPSLTR